MLENIINIAKKWTVPPFDKQIQKEVTLLIQNDTKTLLEAFYKNLEFGTGGMRGIMGIGTNRINKYTLGKATQGLANYLYKTNTKKQHSVVIAYDCRNNSDALAKTVAEVLTANHIKVFLFEALRTTPELSFAVRYLKCSAGIVLTASHNPPEYNGYKVYWKDGGQIIPPQDKEIIQEIDVLDFKDVRWKAKDALLQYIGDKIDTEFVKACIKNADLGLKHKERRNLKIVFTPLHGTTITVIPKALKQIGYENTHIVESQKNPDGNFPTVKSPNPEEPEALSIAMNLAEKIQADIVIGTDPDGDRLGIAVRDINGKLTLLNGNQIMIVMTTFLLDKWQKQNKINGKQFIATTIVSTPMLKKIAKKYNVECKICLTGFKWIGKFIKDFKNLEFIGGGEESFGYMVGDFVRDKDAVTASILACEIATFCKNNQYSFYEILQDLYLEHNVYYEHLLSITKQGQKGVKAIEKIMLDLRKNPLKEIDNEKVLYIYDYLTGQKYNLLENHFESTKLPKSNVLIFETNQGTRLAVRPSGTEPKIKFYTSVNLALKEKKDMKKITKILKEKTHRILEKITL